MTIRGAIATVATCTLLFAALGGVMGYALARSFPNYYRAVLLNVNELWFEPVSVGVGLGVSRGATGGVVVGVVLVVLFVWREVKLAQKPGPADW